MLRTLSRFATLSALLAIYQAGCSSSDAPSAGSAGSGTAGAAAGASGAFGVGGGGASSVAGQGSSSAGTAFGGASVGGASIGGSSAAGSSSGGASAGGASAAGSGGTSQGGTSSNGGSAGSVTSAGSTGIGGTTNSYGTIVGSPAAAKLVALTQNCTTANKIAADTGKFQTDAGKVVHVCSLKGGTGNTNGAVYFTADMDIDCDGLMSTHCPGTGADKDPSYYNQTAFSGPKSTSLTSEKTPYVVVPGEVTAPGFNQNDGGGNIIAIIYKDQIEFAVWGDTIEYQAGDDSEPIGEASVRAAVGLGIPSSPASGGVGSGVTYIAFAGPGAQPKDMEDLAEVQALGTKLLTALLQNNP